MIYEHEYAREMLLATLRHQAGDGHGDGADDVVALVGQALEAGCCRTALIVELASLGARLFARSTDDPLALARQRVGQIACASTQHL
ncbi:MAG: hypothetical protein JO044_08560 [Mycobacteriaceae bacterium]|nr:hypothetical protein [Mycobacteriaceae bacterium]MBV9640289.1 hypothetical protein [Mycobacteriaceae bacterium]